MSEKGQEFIHYGYRGTACAAYCDPERMSESACVVIPTNCATRLLKS